MMIFRAGEQQKRQQSQVPGTGWVHGLVSEGLRPRLCLALQRVL